MIEVQTGTLAQHGLSALLAQLLASRHTGALQLAFTSPEEPEARSSHAQIYVRGGYPVEVLLEDSADRLGVVLLEIGLLDRDRYQRAQALRPSAGKLIGDQMLEARLLDRRSVREGLRTQMRRRLHTLFSREEGRFQIFAGPHTRGVVDGESLASDPRRIIYFGARRALSAVLLQDGLRGIRGFDVQLAPEDATEAARWLPPPEQRLAQILLRGAWSVNDLLTGAQVHPQAVLAFLFTFALTQGLILRSAGNTPRRQAAPAGPAAPALLLPYQPSDEPLPSDQSPLGPKGRLVFMRSGQQTPETLPGLAGLARIVPLVPIADERGAARPAVEVPAATPIVEPPRQSSSTEARAVPEVRRGAASLSNDTGAPPAGKTLPPPQAAPAAAKAPTWSAPPLQTSLPKLRLPTAQAPPPSASPRSPASPSLRRSRSSSDDPADDDKR